MKLTLLMFFLVMLNASASTYSQSARLSLDLKNSTIKEALKAIEDQSEFTFFYNDSQLDMGQKINLKTDDSDIHNILNRLFEGTLIDYQIIDRQIVLTSYKSQSKEINGLRNSSGEPMKSLANISLNKLNQTRTITGNVTDAATGEALPGVNIMVEGTTTGTITDLDGNYSLAIPSMEVNLIFSFVGYNSQKNLVGESDIIDVALLPDLTKLDEVVVVGYGTQKRSLVTGAISSVSAEEIENTSVSRAEQVLQGKSAGVMVLPTSGSPGAGMKVRIRGAGTNGNANPLYIVDGIKASDINYLSPDDIESMEVLKDAASSAIYGAEGGNGVVIITTKSGKMGTGKINYAFQYGMQSAGNLPKLMNAEQYATFMNEAQLFTINPDDFASQTGTNWLNEIFEDAPMQKHHLSFSGGTENTQYFSSLSYYNQDGILGGPKANFKRITGRLNVDQQVNKWLKAGTRISYTNSNRAAIEEDDEFDGLLSGALLIDPITPTHYDGSLPTHVADLLADGQPLRRNDDGRIFGISRYIQGEAVNPLIRLDMSNGSTVEDKILGSFYVDINPLEGLTFTSRVGIDFAQNVHHYWNPTYYYSSERQNSSTSVVDETFSRSVWQWENYVTYQFNLSDNNFSIVAGSSAEQLLYRYLNSTSGPMANEDELFAQHDYTTATTGNIEGNLFEEKLLSYFGRASYDYKNKYLLQATLRYDGASTSLLHPDNQWGAFPSFSAGWVISEEEWWNNTTISFLKLRGSWGQNGSLANLRGVWKDYDDFSPYNGIRQFAYLAAVTSEGIRYPLPGGGYITGAEPGVLSNDNLTWETSQQTNFGVDLRAWDGRLSLTVDRFNKVTKDLLVLYAAPAPAGNNPPFINSGDVENKGWEFNFGIRNYTSALNYRLNLNLTSMNNEVTKLDADVPRIPGMRVGPSWMGATAFEEGEPIWYFRGYKTDGINPDTGDPIFVDMNDDGVITAEDMTNIGNPHPNLIYGGILNLEYGGVDLNIFVQGVSGNQVLMGWIRSDRATSNKPELFYENRWTESNTSASMPKANPDERAYMSDVFVFDGAYTRIKQIQLGYSLPSSVLNIAGFDKARFYVSLDDYFTFTKYKGMDPEAGSDEDASLGIDRGVYPLPKKLMFGLSVTF